MCILPYVHMYANTGLLLARIVMLMPMFIKTLFLALLFVSSSAFAGWQLVDVHLAQGHMFYIDPATIRKDGNMRTFWRKTEYKSRINGDMSARSKIEIDCKKESYRFLALAGFSEPNLMGTTTYQADYPNDPFVSIAPDTIDNTFMQRVCK